MRGHVWSTALIAGLVTTVAGTLAAQQRPGGPEQPSIMQDESQPAVASPQPAAPVRAPRIQIAAPALKPDPNINPEDQFAPSQIKQPMPAAVAEPSHAPGAASKRPRTHTAVGAAPERRPAKPVRGSSLRAVTCSGPFAKDSSNLTLAMVFDSRNVTFTEVDGGAIGKIMASVLFPKDPKRRLEVWWSNPGSRTDIYLIVINGKSGWTAPGGLRLGLTLEELQKLNHKPFKLKGFDKNNVATVSDWDGGALNSFPGGCKAGVSLHADAKASADAVSAVVADHEYSSADPEIRAAKPRTSEILIGY
jgi:hypothetical protein